MKTTRQIYGQFLLSTQTNYTCTYLSQHLESLNENSVYRYLKSEKLTPALIWEKARKAIDFVEDAYIIFDDTVLSKIHSNHIEGVRYQYSGNAKGLIKGIGVVTCLYYNPIMDEYAAIDFRIFDPDRDAKRNWAYYVDAYLMLLYVDSSGAYMDESSAY